MYFRNLNITLEPLVDTTLGFLLMSSELLASPRLPASCTEDLRGKHPSLPVHCSIPCVSDGWPSSRGKYFSRLLLSTCVAPTARRPFFYRALL